MYPGWVVENERIDVKKTLQDGSTRETHAPTADEAEEVVGPGIAALIGILLTGLLYFVLPPNLVLGPRWLLMVGDAVFVFPLIIDIMTKWDLSHAVRRAFVLAPLILSTLALILGVTLFTLTLSKNTDAIDLLRAAGLLWVFNILVFALWYWDVDGGGPWKRQRSGHHAIDFMFPQQTDGKRWAPDFIDYLFVAFTGATAFSPTDTFPLTKVAKVLMMIEAVISLSVITIIAARAVNILGK
jgi:hypothetical protein